MFTSFKQQKYFKAVSGVFRGCLLHSNCRNNLLPFLAFLDDVYFIQPEDIFRGHFLRLQTMFTSFNLQKYLKAVLGVSNGNYFILTKKIFYNRFWRFQTMFTSFKLQKYFEAVFGVFRRYLLHFNFKNIVRPFFAVSDDIYFI